MDGYGFGIIRGPAWPFEVYAPWPKRPTYNWLKAAQVNQSITQNSSYFSDVTIKGVSDLAPKGYSYAKIDGGVIVKNVTINSLLPTKITFEKEQPVTQVITETKLSDPAPPAEVPAPTDLEITKTADKTDVKQGDIITYTIVVKNRTDKTFTNMRVADYIPKGSSLVSRSITNKGKYYFWYRQNVWLVKSIGPGQTFTGSFKVKVSKNKLTKINNTAILQYCRKGDSTKICNPVRGKRPISKKSEIVGANKR
jgi:uncharacterized repeat protein (TIGR01451 family)